MLSSYFSLRIVLCCLKKPKTSPKRNTVVHSRKSSQLPKPKRGILKSGQSNKNLLFGRVTIDNEASRGISPEVSLKYSSNNEQIKSEQSAGKGASVQSLQLGSFLKPVPVYHSTSQQNKNCPKSRKHSTPVMIFQETKFEPRKSSFYKKLVPHPKRNTAAAPMIQGFPIDILPNVPTKFNSPIPAYNTDDSATSGYSSSVNPFP
ncbi:unnamed protein product [Moneuplotes crassus]|uniref:Uncharacterized protein n=1 Tax=Euplotes crassus TaxID=5936 RepID=A0AAD1UAQ6_EUPCR|nr:unnamed protein product [Moneuplotes crassus]